MKNVHQFKHKASDGTMLELKIDLSDDKKIVVKTNFKMKNHMHLEVEYLAWSEMLVNEIIPHLSDNQLRFAQHEGYKAWKKSL